MAVDRTTSSICLRRLVFLCLTVSCSAVIKPIAPRLPFDVTEAPLGTPWPLPQSLHVQDEVYILRKSRFEFLASDDCDILERAFRRYREVIFDEAESAVGVEDAFLLKLTVEVTDTKDCTRYPSHDSVESYTLSIDDGQGVLKADEVWGALKGLETFSQMVYQLDDGWGHEYYINKSTVSDFPRFKYRGIMLDTSRHFIPLDIILRNLDAMSYNKFNVFHWHLVDTQSFPYQSKKFPALSDKGAYHPVDMVYTQKDVAEVVEYARLRGIRVVPEFDTPGHMYSWRKGVPNLLTECWADGKPRQIVYNKYADYGPINPILNSTYEFLADFFSEIVEVFPDTHLHLGADEVSYECWKSNPDVQQFMSDKGWGEDEYNKLEEYYQDRLFKIIGELGAKYIIWQDPIDNGVSVTDQTVVQVWKDTALWYILPPYREGLQNVTALGLQTILSACWYLNMIDYGPDWHQFFNCEPTDFEGSAEQKELVIGGEACLWAEYVDASNLLSRLWPRGSAVAERLWSDQNVTDIDTATVRLDQQRCRMIRRGIPSQPIYPGYCGKYEVPSRGTTGGAVHAGSMSAGLVTSVVLYWLYISTIHFYLFARLTNGNFEDDEK
ncbi:beta-hexosaminidase subunit alpha-like [Ptychodera flava]|uniref:beta-hexosaminidase subunit alpha-like n=1 Tax=Ptychodera flava TaxID=63121 RepID=UPI00396A3E96